MLTVEEILEALRKVEEPELKHNLVALNLVRNLRIFGDRVALTVMLFSEDSSHRELLREKVIATLRQAGVDQVEIEFDTLSAKEQDALAERTSGTSRKGSYTPGGWPPCLAAGKSDSFHLV